MACLCPAPFFTAEYPLQASQELTLAYDVLVADGALDETSCAALVAGIIRRRRPRGDAVQVKESWRRVVGFVILVAAVLGALGGVVRWITPGDRGVAVSVT